LLIKGNLAIEQKPNAGCLDAQTWVKLNAPDTYHQEHTYQQWCGGMDDEDRK
jgi:hypothetical protein